RRRGTRNEKPGSHAASVSPGTDSPIWGYRRQTNSGTRRKWPVRGGLMPAHPSPHAQVLAPTWPPAPCETPAVSRGPSLETPAAIRKRASSVISSDHGHEIHLGGCAPCFCRGTRSLLLPLQGLNQALHPERLVLTLQLCIRQRSQLRMPLVPAGDIAVAVATVGQLHHAARHRHLAKIEGAARAASTSTDHDHAGLRGPDVAVLDTTQRLGKLGQAMASAGQDPHPLLTPFMGGKRLPARFVRHDVLQTQLGN